MTIISFDDLFTDDQAPTQPPRVLNPDQVLPESQRTHFVLVPADDTTSITVEHLGCPLVEVGDSGSGETGWDCFVDWLTADRSVVFFHEADPDFEHVGGGDLATFWVRPGRWELAASVHQYTSFEYGPEQDYEVTVDPAGVVEER